MKSIHFVFETDNKCIRTDRFWSVKQTATCLGPLAFHALGGLKQVNERNVESEVQQLMKPLIKKLEIENNFKTAGIRAINLKDISAAEMLLGKLNACQDAMSETDSTTHNSDVCSHMTLEEQNLMDHSFAQESDADIISQMSENEIENLKCDIQAAIKRPEVPKQFQGSSNKWQNKRN